MTSVQRACISDVTYGSLRRGICIVAEGWTVHAIGMCFLAVQLSGDDIDRTKNRHEVGELVTLELSRETLVVQE
jgi:hypothetical protein